MVGRWFGRLLAVGVTPAGDVECHCICGNKTEVQPSNLARTWSCGCFKKERTSAQKKTHGMTGTPLYSRWSGMKKRCYNRKDKNYYLYGGRGIKVCAGWRDDFLAFLNDMGPLPSPHHTLDRIDVDGDYEPSNCRWADRHEQALNKRATAPRTACVNGHSLIGPRRTRMDKWGHLHCTTCRQLTKKRHRLRKLLAAEVVHG